MKRQTGSCSGLSHDPCPIGSALQGLSPAFFTLSLVATRCHKPWWTKDWLLIAVWWIFSPCLQVSVSGPLTKTPAVGSSHATFPLLGSEHQKVPCRWTFFLPFWLLRTNKKSQTSDPCSLLPKEQNSSVLPAFFFLYLWFKHSSIWPYQAFSRSFGQSANLLASVSSKDFCSWGSDFANHCSELRFNCLVEFHFC